MELLTYEECGTDDLLHDLRMDDGLIGAVEILNELKKRDELPQDEEEKYQERIKLKLKQGNMNSISKEALHYLLKVCGEEVKNLAKDRIKLYLRSLDVDKEKYMFGFKVKCFFNLANICMYAITRKNLGSVDYAEPEAIEFLVNEYFS